MSAPPFSEYRAHLASDEYKASLRKLLDLPPDAPRDSYPLDVSDRVRMHNELGNQLLRSAVSHFQAEADLLAEVASVTAADTQALPT